MENFISFKDAICSTALDFCFWYVVGVFFLINVIMNWHCLNNLDVFKRKAFWIETLVVAFLALMGLSYLYYGYGYSIDNHYLRLYRHFSEMSLNRNDIVEVSIVDTSDIHTKLKVNGIAMANFKAGKYWLSNGEKALVFIYHPENKAVLIRTINNDLIYINDSYSKELYNVLFNSNR